MPDWRVWIGNGVMAGLELLAVDWVIGKAGCLDAVMTRGGQEGGPCGSAAGRVGRKRGAVGLCPGLMDRVRVRKTRRLGLMLA